MLTVALVLLYAASASCKLIWSNPPGPQFTDEEKAAQVKKGSTLIQRIVSSFNANASTYTIEPGDYRWPLPANPSVSYQVVFSDLHRSSTNPFAIRAYGVTFWLTVNANVTFRNGTIPNFPLTRGIIFLNCSNIHLYGLTVDSDPRGVIEGKVVQVDTNRNRLQLLLSPGSFFQPFRNPETGDASGNFLRFLPYKGDGTFMTPLYGFQKNRGLYLSNLTKLDSNNTFYAYLRNTKLLSTTMTSSWKQAYGSQGVLEPNDGISIIYSGTFMLELDNCENLTIDSVTSHAAKGKISMTGGEGGHLIRNYSSMPRPHTNQLYGGEGGMVNALRRGPTFDSITIRTSSDDIMNFHGYWGYVSSVQNDQVVFVKSSFNARSTALLRPGDRAIFYNMSTFATLGTAAVVKALAINVIQFNRTTGVFNQSIAYFPDISSANWVMKNSHFIDCYQRVLIQNGPGTFINNTLERVGSSISIRSTKASYNEGGIPHNIVVANNRLMNVTAIPYSLAFGDHGAPIYVGGSNELKLPIYNNITIVNNTIVNPGDTGINIWTSSDFVIEGNTIVNPHLSTFVADNGTDGHPQAIFVDYSKNGVVRNNCASDPNGVCKKDNVTGSIVLGLGENVANVSFIDSLWNACP